MDITVVKLILLFFTLKFSKSEIINGKNQETLLLNTVFKDYDERIRPVANYHTPVLVGFGIELQQILQVDEKHQVITMNVMRSVIWKDDFLQWMPENYGNITQILLRRSRIWTPEIQLFNSASFDNDEVVSHRSTKVAVSNNGVAVDALPVVLKATCRIDVTWFPFDEQKCSLVFGSWILSSKFLQLNVEKYESNGTMDNNGEWSLLGVTSQNSSETYPCCPDDPYNRIIYTIHLKRRPFYYFFNLLVPCGLIGFLAILAFTLPPESGEKLPLGATLLFSLIVFLNMISETMPANSDTVPLLGISTSFSLHYTVIMLYLYAGTYFNCVMFTIALSVVSTIVVNVNVKAGKPKEVTGFPKKLFLRWLPRILRMDIPSTIVDEQDKAVTQQWSFVADVVDRMCLAFSVIFSFISVIIFLIYADQPLAV